MTERTVDYAAVLDLPMQDNDSGATTVRGYLGELLLALWGEGEGFSGKRPFGNSGWEYDLYYPLLNAGLVDGILDEDGFIEEVDAREARRVVAGAIRYLVQSQPETT